MMHSTTRACCGCGRLHPGPLAGHAAGPARLRALDRARRPGLRVGHPAGAAGRGRIRRAGDPGARRTAPAPAGRRHVSRPRRLDLRLPRQRLRLRGAEHGLGEVLALGASRQDDDCRRPSRGGGPYPGLGCRRGRRDQPQRDPAARLAGADEPVQLRHPGRRHAVSLGPAPAQGRRQHAREGRHRGADGRRLRERRRGAGCRRLRPGRRGLGADLPDRWRRLRAHERGLPHPVPDRSAGPGDRDHAAARARRPDRDYDGGGEGGRARRRADAGAGRGAGPAEPQPEFGHPDRPAVVPVGYARCAARQRLGCRRADG